MRISKAWARWLVALACLAVIVAIVVLGRRDCEDVCAERGEMHVETDIGCVVACLCRPGVKHAE